MCVISLNLLWPFISAGSKGSQSQSSDLLREETGLGWMLRPKNSSDEISNKSSIIEPEEASVEEVYFLNLCQLLLQELK